VRHSSGIGVIDKSVAILDAVAARPCALSDLVEETRLPRATAHRLAVALEVHELLDRDGDGRFVLGPRVGELAAARPDPFVLAAPVLAWVRDESGESAQLYRRDGTERVCIASAERTHGLRTTVPVGSRLPLTAGSGAQVLCAWLTDEPVRSSVLSQARFTERTLVEVRRRGWAQSVGQREAGVASVSAPVRDGSGAVVAALSISGPIERLSRSPGARYAPIIVGGARRISQAIAA
jgi:DNA-binding IclR family transcriptional regulator